MTDALTPPPLTAIPAHGVRQPVLHPADEAAQAARVRDVRDSREQDLFADIIRALKTGPLVGFDMGSTAVVGAAGVEGRVWIRADGRVFTLTTLDASLLALLVRIDAMRGADLFADALVRGSIDAERRVEAIHHWSGRIRPTEDAE